MKKHIALLLACCLLLGLLAGCGGSAPAPAEQSRSEQDVAQPDTEKEETEDTAPAEAEPEKQYVPRKTRLLVREYRENVQNCDFPLLTEHIYNEFGEETELRTTVDYSGIPMAYYMVPDDFVTEYDDNGELALLERLLEGGAGNLILSYTDGQLTERGWENDNYREYYEYDAAGRCVKKTVRSTDLLGWYTDVYSYDAAGRTLRFDETHDTFFYEEHGEYSYDERGNLLTVREQTLSNSDGEQFSTAEYTYDENDNELTAHVVAADGSEKNCRYTYDEHNNLLSALETADGAERELRFAYDEDNLLLTAERYENGSLTKNSSFTYTREKTSTSDKLFISQEGDALELDFYGDMISYTYSSGGLPTIHRAYTLRPYGSTFAVYKRTSGTEIGFIDASVDYVSEEREILAEVVDGGTGAAHTSVEEMLPALSASYGGYPLPASEDGWRLKQARQRLPNSLEIVTDISYGPDGAPAFFDSYWYSSRAAETDELGRPTEASGYYTFSYSADNACTVVTDYGNTPPRAEVYDLLGRRLESFNINRESGENINHFRYSYDESGRLIGEESVSSSGEAKPLKLHYSDDGRTLDIAAMEGTPYERYEFDENGRVLRIVDLQRNWEDRFTYEDGLRTMYTFIDNGAVSMEDSCSYSYEADDEGCLRSVEEEIRGTVIRFDEHGNLLQFRDTNGLNEILYTYEWEEVR